MQLSTSSYSQLASNTSSASPLSAKIGPQETAGQLANVRFSVDHDGGRELSSNSLESTHLVNLPPGDTNCVSVNVNSFDDIITRVGAWSRYQWRMFVVTQLGYLVVAGSLLQVGFYNFNCGIPGEFHHDPAHQLHTHVRRRMRERHNRCKQSAAQRT